MYTLTNTEYISPAVDEANRPSKQQLKLLGFLSSRRFSDEEIGDIQNLIADYYAEKTDTEMDALIEKKGWRQEDFDQMASEHIRTSYRAQTSK